jgi:hypothetical protein
MFYQELSILRGEEVDGPDAKPRCSEELDREGTTFWKWFNGNSFETVLDPRAKSDQPASRSSRLENSRGFLKVLVLVTRENLLSGK